MLALVEGIATGAFKLDNTSAGHLRKYDALLKVILRAIRRTEDRYPPGFCSGRQAHIRGAAKSTARIEAAKALPEDATPDELN